jgi:hypothetical protein
MTSCRKSRHDISNQIQHGQNWTHYLSPSNFVFYHNTFLMTNRPANWNQQSRSSPGALLYTSPPSILSPINYQTWFISWKSSHTNLLLLIFITASQVRASIIFTLQYLPYSVTEYLYDYLMNWKKNRLQDGRDHISIAHHYLSIVCYSIWNVGKE